MKNSPRHLKRIKDANFIWKQYNNLKGGDSEYQDIITDILHLASANAQDIKNILFHAEDHFQMEQMEEADPENPMR